MQEQQQKTIIIHPEIKARDIPGQRTIESKLEEAKGLALAINLDVVKAEVAYLQKIIPSTHLGSGKVEEIRDFVKANEIDLAIIDSNITPIQQRNLEKEWNCKVIDRTALILEIFGARAHTKEGSLQVELALLEYQKSRLVRSWTHLERQRGGSGKLGGPGETQIESDRRALRDEISKIKKRLQKVVQTREIHRKSRQKIPYEVVALVGYTNAGKSTLFNKLTGAEVMAEDMLFATLDPTMRLIKLPSGRKIIMSDTVGFISDLPTELVAAFRATLEEVVEANIMIHVRDIANQDTDEQKKDVLSVLKNLGLEAQMHENMIEVLNKVDLLDPDHLQEANELTTGRQNVIAVSAVTGHGIDNLLEVIDKKLAKENKITEVTIPCANGQLIAWVHANAEIIKQNQEDSVIHFELSLTEANLGRLNKMLIN
ncbi:MAG: putative GTPase [Rickettsiaceae bacterium]|jgi:GTP-binding protein HflX|nr:putative GTPase [Rickettsiaceae bacterium]